MLSFFAEAILSCPYCNISVSAADSSSTQMSRILLQNESICINSSSSDICMLFESTFRRKSQVLLENEKEYSEWSGNNQSLIGACFGRSLKSFRIEAQENGWIYLSVVTFPSQCIGMKYISTLQNDIIRFNSSSLRKFGLKAGIPSCIWNNRTDNSVRGNHPSGKLGKVVAISKENQSEYIQSSSFEQKEPHFIVVTPYSNVFIDRYVLLIENHFERPQKFQLGISQPIESNGLLLMQNISIDPSLFREGKKRSTVAEENSFLKLSSDSEEQITYAGVAFVILCLICFFGVLFACEQRRERNPLEENRHQIEQESFGGAFFEEEEFLG